MALYDDFPYTNFHSLNLDWIVKKLSELENGESTEESSSTATLARNLTGNYPYTNFHSLNLDWVIRSMLELESDFETLENEWENLNTTALLNDQVKNAILQCFENVAWVNDQGQQYYNTLHDIFFPPVIVNTLTAVLDQGERVFHVGEDINNIKNYLTVTAELSDDTTITVPAARYILTGSLSQEGPNIITVTYMNASTTITVNAVAVNLVSISAVYTQSGIVHTTDTLNSLKSDLVVTATYSDSSTETVPSADYTLSGTLTEGTSTITVTYEGLTTTFNVTVSEYSGWTYTPSMGLLSEQDFVEVRSSSTLSVTENIVDNSLHILIPQGSGTNRILDFIPNNFTNYGYLKFKIKFAKIGYNQISTVSTNGTPVFRLSNGTQGVNVGFARYGSSTDDLKIRCFIGDTASWGSSLTMNEWHTIEMEYIDNKQFVKVDGITELSNTAAATIYTANNLFMMAPMPNGQVEFYIDEIEYRGD